MFGESKQASSAKTSLIYLTVGALTVVWTLIYYMYLRQNGASENAFLWCYGFLLSGLVLLAIGFGVGHIGRSAMPAEVAATPDIAVVAGGNLAAGHMQANAAIPGVPSGALTGMSPTAATVRRAAPVNS